MLPMKKHFKNVSYDKESRVFKAQIDWRPTSLQGDTFYEYCLIFSEDFKSIARGNIQSKDINGKPNRGLI